MLEETEGHLGHKELVVVAVMTLHLGALSRDLLYAIIISAVQLLQLVMKIVSFISEFLINTLNIGNLVIILQI